MTMPVAYIRRSVARAGDPGDVSRDFQTTTVRSLANGDGPTLHIIDGDWGRSAAGEKTDKRLAFLGLLSAVERGEVSTLYAYSTDRLARSVRWAAQLLDACEAAGTTIVTSEGRFAPGDDMARQMFHFQAMQNEGALRQMTAKSTATAGKRKERGDVMGRAPYGYIHKMVDGVSTLVPRDGESPATVVEAFKVAGAYNKAAKLLNGPKGLPVVDESGETLGTGYGLPTRFEGRRWDPTTVRHVVMKHAPELAPVHTRRGATTRSTRLFAGLLRCPHADLHPNTPVLTSSVAKYAAKGTTYSARYYCRVANFDQSHPRPYIVAESKILPWAMETMKRDAKPRLRAATRGKAPDPGATLDALDERRERFIEMRADGVITREELKRRLDAIDAEMPALELGRRAGSVLSRMVAEREGIDWAGDPAEVNATLRNLLHHIELDAATMLPIRAVWNVGEGPWDEAKRAEYEAEPNDVSGSARTTTEPSS